MDSQARVVLPQKLRDAAKLNAESERFAKEEPDIEKTARQHDSEVEAHGIKAVSCTRQGGWRHPRR